MDPAQRDEADRQFEKALEDAGARDPRGFYRQALRELKELNPQAYDGAVDHFQDTLVPSIASGEAEPLHAWREYGRIIAEATADGRTVEIDATGRARPFSSETPMDRMVLHLPHAKGGKAILVSLPPEPSGAQRATYDLLVKGKQKLPDAG